MPVSSILIPKFLRSTRNSSVYSSLDVDILILYVSDIYNVGFLSIFTLMICVARSSSNSYLISEIGGGSMRAYTSARNNGPFFIVGYLSVVVQSVFTSHIVTFQSVVHVR